MPTFRSRHVGTPRTTLPSTFAMVTYIESPAPPVSPPDQRTKSVYVSAAGTLRRNSSAVQTNDSYEWTSL